MFPQLSEGCDTFEMDIPIQDIINVVYGETTETVAGIDEQLPIRVGPFKAPTVVHVVGQHPDNECPQVNIQRVVTCPKDCDVVEFKYDFPCVCEANKLLPAGTYDITVCKQELSNVAAGDTFTIKFLIEPVDDSFANIYLGLRGAGNGS